MGFRSRARAVSTLLFLDVYLKSSFVWAFEPINQRLVNIMVNILDTTRLLITAVHINHRIIYKSEVQYSSIILLYDYKYIYSITCTHIFLFLPSFCFESFCSNERLQTVAKQYARYTIRYYSIAQHGTAVCVVGVRFRHIYQYTCTRSTSIFPLTVVLAALDRFGNTTY